MPMFFIRELYEKVKHVLALEPFWSYYSDIEFVHLQWPLNYISYGRSRQKVLERINLHD